MDSLLNRITDEQNKFIEKVIKRYKNSSFSKKELFNYWDYFVLELSLFDGRIIKSSKHYNNLKNDVLNCGSYLCFKAGTSTEKIKLQSANFCRKDKLCPSCAVGRAYNQQKKFLKILDAYTYHHNDDLLSKHWYYIVTPVKHSIDEDLKSVYEKIYKLKKSALMQIRDGKRGKSNGFWSIFNGGMGSIETTYTTNGWNIHINWLINSDIEIEIEKVVDKRGKEWYQNRDLALFLNKIDNSSIHSISKLDFGNEDKIRESLLEVLKYSLKFSSLDIGNLLKVYYTFYGKRLFFTFGNLWGLDLECVNDVYFNEFDINDEFINLVFRRLPDLSYKVVS